MIEDKPTDTQTIGEEKGIPSPPPSLVAGPPAPSIPTTQAGQAKRKCGRPRTRDREEKSTADPGAVKRRARRVLSLVDPSSVIPPEPSESARRSMGMNGEEKASMIALADEVARMGEGERGNLLVYKLPRETWRRFAWLVAEGTKPRDAYRECYPDASTDEVCRVCAWDLLQRPTICAAIDELQDIAGQALLRRMKHDREEAYKTLLDAVHGEATDVQMRAARDILDRTGVIRREGIDATFRAGGRNWETTSEDLPR